MLDNEQSKMNIELIEAIKELRADVAELKALFNAAPEPDDVASQVQPVPEKHVFYYGTHRTWAWEGFGIGVIFSTIFSIIGLIGAYFGLDMTSLEEVNTLLSSAGITTIISGALGAFIGSGLLKEETIRRETHR